MRDKKNVHAYCTEGVSSDGLTYRINMVKYNIGMAAVRLVAWSLPSPFPEARSFEAKTDVIENMDEGDFDAITAALTAHDKARSEAAEQEKNAILAGASV